MKRCQWDVVWSFLFLLTTQQRVFDSWMYYPGELAFSIKGSKLMRVIVFYVRNMPDSPCNYIIIFYDRVTQERLTTADKDYTL